MEGSAAEDLAAPDSWEMADLDESMRRLLVSPPKRAPSPPERDLAPPAPFASSSSTGPLAAAASGGISDDVLDQVDQFLREALEKPRERLAILRMEQDVEKFIRDPTQQQLEFQSLPTSYLRLAAHRVAQHYNLQSVALADGSSLDGSGSRILLHKTSECRFPQVRLADIPVNLPQEDNKSAVKVAIKQRPGKQSRGIGNTNSHSSKNSNQRSVEERKEEYNRARARIFSSSSSGGYVGKSEVEPTLTDSFQHHSLVSTRQDGRSANEPSEMYSERGLSDSSGSNRSLRNRIENEPVVSRYRVSNRVAIFRDREVDRKDPDYDRSYDRYMQRFDPGFGFNGGAYTLQPLYTPAVNYNTEFPQLRSGYRPPPLSLDQQLRSIPPELRAHWSPTPAPTAIGYGPPEAMIPPFSPSHLGAPATSPIYMHSPQYPIPPRHGVSFVHPHEHVQHFQQAHPQQPEQSFGLARPR